MNKMAFEGVTILIRWVYNYRLKHGGNRNEASLSAPVMRLEIVRAPRGKPLTRHTVGSVVEQTKVVPSSS